MMVTPHYNSWMLLDGEYQTGVRLRDIYQGIRQELPEGREVFSPPESEETKDWSAMNVEPQDCPPAGLHTYELELGLGVPSVSATYLLTLVAL